MKWLIVVMIVTASKTILAGIAPPGSCPAVCDCKWKGGKQSVECVNRALITVPEPVDTATQVLNLSGNNLQILPQEAFARTGLVNLQRLHLRSCNIGQINDRAFKDLTNLVELDISHNLLTQIPSNSFKDTPSLRELMLSNNPILKIHSDALNSLGSIVKLDLSSCDIRDISFDVFNNLKLLKFLNLNNNNLQGLPLRSFEKLDQLSINLSNNPWICDCRLRDLKIWLLNHKMFSELCCALPTRLANKSISELALEEFACKPEILPINRHVEAAIGENVTMVCRTEAVPSANINWYWNGRLLQNGTNFNSYQRIYTFEEGDVYKNSTLLLTNHQESSLTEFYCVAENKGGSVVANFSVHLTQTGAGIAFLSSTQIAILGGFLLIVILLGLLMVRLIPVRCRSTPVSVNKPTNTLHRVVPGNEDHPTASDRPHEDVLNDRQESPNYDETKCNPILKPPRSNDIPYTTNHSEGRGSLVRATVSVVVSPTVSGGIDPDLINDTRPESANRPGSGEYTREASDSLYPSGLWDQIKLTQANNLSRVISTAIPAYYNDRTPIIDNTSVNGSHEELGHMSRTFPRSHVMSSANVGSMDVQYPVDYGLPVGGARTLRVWQRAPPVLPPVSALKRVLAITRPTEDGFQDGRATDV